VLIVHGWLPVPGVLIRAFPVGCNASVVRTLGSTPVILAPVSISARTLIAVGTGCCAAVKAVALAVLMPMKASINAPTGLTWMVK